jgi:excisionase family DNA binding protein
MAEIIGCEDRPGRLSVAAAKEIREIRAALVVMTLPETAKYLAVARPHLYMLMSKEGLPAHRMGHRWKFFRHEVDNWLAHLPAVNRPKESA